VSSPEDQVREAFLAHEELAPDPAAVYARVQELSRTYKWRRRGAAAAGGVVVGVGLVAGIAGLPGVIHGQPQIAPATHPPAASAAPSLSAEQIKSAVTAYTEAGYTGTDAEKLAALWHLPAGDLTQVKVEAGQRLLAGQTLPIPAVTATVDPNVAEALQAYFAGGYNFEDATALAKLWKLSDTDAAKVEAGKRLLAGETLPIGKRQSAEGKANLLETKRVAAFFHAGYSVDDAASLAKIWHTKTSYDAKVEGGKRLLAGESLPFKP
jgi:hypothetical protein